MTELCTDPTCLEHWPTVVADLGSYADRMTEWAEASVGASSIVDDITRAMATVAAAEPHYRHDCHEQRCLQNRTLFGDTGANPVGWRAVIEALVDAGWTPPRGGNR